MRNHNAQFQPARSSQSDEGDENEQLQDSVMWQKTSEMLTSAPPKHPLMLLAAV